MTREQKWQVRSLLDKTFMRADYIDKRRDHDERVDEFLKELEKIWPDSESGSELSDIPDICRPESELPL